MAYIEGILAVFFGCTTFLLGTIGWQRERQLLNALQREREKVYARGQPIVCKAIVETDEPMRAGQFVIATQDGRVASQPVAIGVAVEDAKDGKVVAGLF